MATWCFLERATGEFVAVVVAAALIMERREKGSRGVQTHATLSEPGLVSIGPLHACQTAPRWPRKPVPSADPPQASSFPEYPRFVLFTLPCSVGQLVLDSLSIRLGARFSPDKSIGGHIAETRIDINDRPFDIALYKTCTYLGSFSPRIPLTLHGTIKTPP